MKWPVQTRRAYWTTIALVASLVAALCYHVICGEHGYLAYRSDRKEYLKLQKQGEELRHENDAIEKHVHALKTNPEAIEKEAREQLHLARPGEIILTYSDDTSNSKTPANPSPPPASQLSPTH